MECIADRPAADSGSGVIGVNSWCPVANVVIYNPETKQYKFINTLHANFVDTEIIAEHVNHWHIAEAMLGSVPFRAFVDDIPGLLDEVKSQFHILDSSLPLDYSQKPDDDKSAAGRQWHKTHRARIAMSKTLGIPFLRQPQWPMVTTKLFDILHFGLCKSVHYLLLIAEHIRHLPAEHHGVFIALFMDSSLKTVFGKQWQHLLLGQTSELHVTGPIYRDVYLKMPELFALWEPLIADMRQLKMFGHLFVNCQRFMQVMSILSQHEFVGGEADPQLQRLQKLQQLLFISDWRILRDLKPYDWIAYLAILPAQLCKVHDSFWNHGLSEASTSKGENLNHYMKNNDQHNNGDWDQLVRSGNESDLQKMDWILNDRCDLQRLLRGISKNRKEIWSPSMASEFDAVKEGFKRQTNAVVHLFQTHDWRRNPAIPHALLPYINGTFNVRRRRQDSNSTHSSSRRQRRRTGSSSTH